MGAVKRKAKSSHYVENAQNSAKKKKVPRKKVIDNPQKLPVNGKSMANRKSNDTDIEHRWSDGSSYHLVVKPGLKWFHQLPKDVIGNSLTLPQNVIADMKTQGQTFMNEDKASYNKFLERRKEKADFSWMKTILHSGTLSDKISAHTVLIQDSPVHNVNSIEVLISMVNPKGKRECIMALDCLKDLFRSDLLRTNKKLQSFEMHPLGKLDELTSGNLVAKKKRLILWYFEDLLKSLYEKFLKNVEVVSRDTVEKTKQKSVTAMYELLKDSPEQEQYLLEHLVNKIGDPVPKVGSHACHLLGQLVYYKQMMISAVVKETERLLFRPNVSERAKYYCLCLLNQLVLSQEQSNVANHLITMYFGLFKMCIKKGDVNTKMMSALLTGVGRAYPYAKLKSDVVMEQLDAMFQLVHMVSFNISVQTLMLIFQVLDSKDSLSDRFYCALYRKILDPALSSSTRQSMLLNLLYKALKKDVAQVRIRSFVKRLIQVALYQSSSLQCGILMLISELVKSHPDLLVTHKAVVYSTDSDSEEHFEDVVDEDDTEAKKSKEVPLSQSSSSWVHRQQQETKWKKKSGYDPQNRNPLHSGAEYSNLWELLFLKKNFHPSVSLFAHQVSNSIDINYEGDPMQDFTIIRYLDRFVYKNPKQTNAPKQDYHRKVFGRKLKPTSEFSQVPVSSDSYTQQKEDKIPVEERFIYKYLKQHRSASKSQKDDSDLESVNSDEFNAFLDDIDPEDEGRGKIDFAKELSSYKQKSTKKDDEQEDNDSNMESLEESDLDSNEVDFENDEVFQEAFEDFDEDMETIHQDQETNDEGSGARQFSKKSKNKSKKSTNSGNIFASADEFSMLLEDNTAYDATSSEAFLNTDKSAMKQLAWEKQRHQFVKGTDWKSRKRQKKRQHVNKKKTRK